MQIRNSGLVERGEIEHIVCDSQVHKWYRAEDKRLVEEIEHLRRIPGIPGSRAGPNMCGRVSCSWDSATWWCNDVRFSPFSLLPLKVWRALRLRDRGGFADLATFFFFSLLFRFGQNDHPVEPSSFAEIGDGADATLKDCHVGTAVYWTRGQAFL